jgi:hypothetical protein
VWVFDVAWALEHKGGEECRLAVVEYAHPEVTP